MNYIFFDIECANCYGGNGKICSFGYVVTDTFYNIIEKDDIIINPKANFMLSRNGRDYIKLAYTRDEFRRAPDFSAVYRRIKALLCRRDSMVFGYASENDSNFLRSECERYILPCINFKSYDVQKMLRYEMKLKNMISLSSAETFLGVTCRQEIHKSDDDSYMTMEVLRNLCLKARTSPELLAKKYPQCVNELREYSVIQLRREGKNFREVIMGDRSDIAEFGSDNFLCAQRYIYYVKGEEKNNLLSGKRIYLYPGFISKNYRTAVKLIKLIADCGGQVSEKPHECDFYVCSSEYDDFGNMTLKPDAEKVKELYKKIIPCTPLELTELAGFDYGDLMRMSTPDISYLLADSYEVKVSKRRRPFRRRAKRKFTDKPKKPKSQI